ncbi:tetratricopeptide repeat protein [Actinomadura scrupuli]|uniref:tetratricopeptide repeat protein n=1 Tax=Actinomadura scrupuli TaxID=559629 RepID=UPI003D98C297
MDARQRIHDVFLCYKWEDSEAARALYEALVSRGLDVFLDAIDGPIWAPLGDSIRDALNRSRTLVALITPRFPISPHCREELHTALLASYYLDGDESARVMAIAQGVSPDDVEPYRLSWIRLPMHGIPQDELVAGIIENVERHDGVFGDMPGRPRPRWIPGERSTGPFRGRFAEVWRLHHALRSRVRAADGGPPVAVINGTGGVGKTALSMQFAKLFARDHPGGIFILELGGSDGRSLPGDGRIMDRVEEQRQVIAESLGLPDAAGLEAGLDALDEDYLWIVDDLPTMTSPELFARLRAPTGRGKTIVTTRATVVRDAPLNLALGPLDGAPAEAVLTTFRRAGRAERRAVSAIVELLGGLPLGLTIAAGLTTLPGFRGYQDLLADLSSADFDRLENAAQLEGQLPVGCARPFTRALLRSFDSFGDAGRDVLCAASVLGPTVIPHDLLAGMVRRSSGAEVSENEVAPILDRGMLGSADGGYLMHALVARALRVVVAVEERRRLLRLAAIEELTDLVERTRRSHSHRHLLNHLPHVRAVAGLMTGGDAWDIGLNERHLVVEAGRTQLEAGLGRDALAALGELWRQCEGLESLDAETRYVLLVALGAAHDSVGDHTVAAGLADEAWAGLARDRGPHHPDTMTALENAAVARLGLREYDWAFAMLLEVYEARCTDENLGPAHRRTLQALSNLAIAESHRGDGPAARRRHQEEAHVLWRRARAQWRRIAPADDPGALDALNGLALSHYALGELEEALKCADELYHRRERLLGPDHPDTLGSLENMLVIMEALRGRPRRAVPADPDEAFAGDGPGPSADEGNGA